MTKSLYNYQFVNTFTLVKIQMRIQISANCEILC